MFPFGLTWVNKIYNFFHISNTLISNERLKLTKIQANAKQHPEAEILLFENYSHSWSTLSSKIRHILKNKQKNKCVCIHEIVRLIILKMKMKNRSHRYNINRCRSIHWHKYSVCKKCLTMMMLICIKQHLLKLNSWKRKATLRLSSKRT